MNPTKDWCTRAGAYELAQHIQSYWATRGKAVETMVLGNEDVTDGRKSIFSIRSNIVLHAPETVKQLEALA